MSGARLTDEERIDWLRLIRSENVGPRTFRALIAQFGSASAAIEALPDLSRRGGRLVAGVTSRADAERELERAGRLGARFIALGEPDYPKTLQATETAPPMIAVRGDAAALSRPTVAVVGSRNASAAGLTFTECLSRSLGEAGYVVVSGLARGIDTRAHRASLRTGTVAVLAGGHERIYPSENQGLLQAILDEGGAVVSEMPVAWEPRGRDFPRRNRIVSGLSYGVVVVEAARRSGSLITARFALEQGREVFAVPGSPLDPRAEGTNDLIRDGATLCAAPEHVTSVLEPLIGTELRPAPAIEEPVFTRREAEPWEEIGGAGAFLAPQPAASRAGQRAGERDRQADPQQILVGLLGPVPTPIDDLIRQSGLPARSVQLALLELELAGRLERHGGRAVSLVER